MVLVASDPDDRFVQVVDCPVWVVQMNEEDNHTDVIDKINNIIFEYFDCNVFVGKIFVLIAYKNSTTCSKQNKGNNHEQH